jgi:transposase
VRWVSIDLSSTYRSQVKRFFPKALVVADRFHVHRLFTRLVNRFRKKITGDDRKNPIRKLLLRNERDLEPHERRAIWVFLNRYPEVREVYQYKEAINRLYRIKGYARAKAALIRLLDCMGTSKIEKVKTLRTTILNWRHEILGYFIRPLTNGRVEGFNRKAKLLQRKAYGYSSFKNYRLRVLNETSVKHSRPGPTIK